MKQIIVKWLVLGVILSVSVPAIAEQMTVNVAGEKAHSSSNQITVQLALPEDVIGKRIDKAILEVPIAVGASADSVFIRFPLAELVQSGSEEPKQTALLAQGFDGIASFDVTRFVQSWSTTDEHQFNLGALSGSNQTVLGLGTAGGWESGVKARLIVKYSSLAGASATTIGNP